MKLITKRERERERAYRPEGFTKLIEQIKRKIEKNQHPHQISVTTQ
jgi:hypothetical protein